MVCRRRESRASCCLKRTFQRRDVLFCDVGRDWFHRCGDFLDAEDLRWLIDARQLFATDDRHGHPVVFVWLVTAVAGTLV